MSIQISIVIATYNAAATLNRCLDSVVSQLNEETELIVIDGNSSDETCDIISSYREHIAYTISENDRGIYDAWNKGINVARGEWIAFLGADDILLPNAIETYLRYIHSRSDIQMFDYICANNEIVDENGKFVKIYGDEPSWEKMKKRLPSMHVASLHNKKNLFDKIGYFDTENFHICADYELLIRKKNQLKYVMLPYTIARIQIGGMSVSVEAIKESYFIRKKYKSVSCLLNVFLYLRALLVLKTYKLRHFMHRC